MIHDPLSRHLPPMLRGTFAWKPDSVQPQQQDLMNAILQIYQGTANVAGPNANLAAATTPVYTDTALSDKQRSMFGYTSPAGGGVGTPNAPPGGFFGAPSAMVADGGVVGPPTPAGSPAATPVPGAPANGTSTSTAGGAGSLYSPPQGTRIGMGHEFNDPYAGGFDASSGASAGYHPGTLDLNTSALSSFGPLATLGILGSNPFAADALSVQDANLVGSMNHPLLDLLNSQASDQLKTGGALTPEQIRQNAQDSLSVSSAGGSQNTDQAFATQLLSRSALQQKRLQDAQQLGALVQGLNTNQQGVTGNLASQAASSATSAITNPILQILGLGNLGSVGGAGVIDANNTLTSGTNQLGADILGFNNNAASAAGIANANNAAATNAGYWQLLGEAFSDERIKKKIKTVGKSPSGIPIKEWEYKTDEKGRRYRGAMAQDLEKIAPFAVVKDPVSGLKAVAYNLIDVDFSEVSPFRKAA